MIDSLQTFIAVASLGSFSSAAKSEGVAVSSVTRRIELLEADMGARLFNRTTRALSLTEAGTALLPRARDIVDEVGEARRAVAALHAEPRGMLRITAPSAFSRLHLVPALARFAALYPLLHFELEASDHTLDLMSNRLDLAIRIGVLPDSDLLASRLAPQYRVACASPAYLARRGTPSSPADLLAHDCLTTTVMPAPSGWWKFGKLNGGRPLAVKGPFKCSDPGALVQAAVAGLGVVHLASWLVGGELATGRLVALFEGDEPSTEDGAIYAVRLSGRAQAAKAGLLIDHLKTSLSTSSLSHVNG